MDNELRITIEETDIIEVQLCPNKTPIAYQRKKKELVECSGMTEEEADKYLLTPIPLEIFYSNQGLFGVEAECLDSCEIYNPYTGEEIPNDNLL